MNLDRDLREALQPLAGDPVEDAARVLAALPMLPDATATPPAARPWLPWAAMAAGLTVGAVLGAWLGSTEKVVEVPVVQQPTDSRGGPKVDPGAAGSLQPTRTYPDQQTPKVDPGAQKQERPADPMAGWPSMKDERLEMFEIMAFGEIEINEPLEGRQKLNADRWLVRLGTRFMTGDSQVGLYVFANDARARIDRETSVQMFVDETRLEFGRVWLDSGGRNVTLRVEAGVAEALVEAGSCVLTRTPSGLDVLSLGGKVTIRTAAETLQLRPNERAFVDADLGLRERRRVEFLGAETSWMTNMVIMGTDRSELVGRVTDMVDAYEEGTHREEARREILKLGARCVWQLAASAERNLARDRDYALATAALVAQIVDFPSARYALPLLMTDDAELREIVFRGLQSATGTDADTSTGFWRDAGLEERRSAVERWDRLLRF